MMKKGFMLLIAAIGLSLFLVGCSKEKDDFGIGKAQKIEVVSADNPEVVLHVIENKDEVHGFVEKLKINKWSAEDLPSDATKGAMYKLYQEDTVKLGESKTDEKGLKQIATMITYKDRPFIKLSTKKTNFEL
ncbi:hypothetical protein [Bacillus testis]|uniref:hypothetical protein n=1 Tax=Bacillus testis TaxID=1622072 RepID=UPI000AD0AAD6|nr:hypothetical protein [Bacillus testis]